MRRCVRTGARGFIRSNHGGEFLVHGIMEPIPPDHPAASLIATITRVPLAFFALSVDEAVGTTYEGADRDPVYRRWRSEGA